MNKQMVDLNDTRERAELAGLLTNQRIRQAKVTGEIMLVLDDATVTFTQDRFDEVFTVTITDRTANGPVPCKWCNKPTKYVFTKECDTCFALHDQLQQSDRAIVNRMMAELNKTI